MFNRRWHLIRLLLLCSFMHMPVGAVPAQKIMKLAEAEQPKAMKTWEALVNIDTGTAYKQGLARAQALLVNNLMALGADVKITPASPAVGPRLARGSGAGRGQERRHRARASAVAAEWLRRSATGAHDYGAFTKRLAVIRHNDKGPVARRCLIEAYSSR